MYNFLGKDQIFLRVTHKFAQSSSYNLTLLINECQIKSGDGTNLCAGLLKISDLNNNNATHLSFNNHWLTLESDGVCPEQ